MCKTQVMSDFILNLYICKWLEYQLKYLYGLSGVIVEMPHASVMFFFKHILNCPTVPKRNTKLLYILELIERTAVSWIHFLLNFSKRNSSLMKSIIRIYI